VTARRICLFGVLLLAFGGAFAQGIQRVWAVDDGERIKATVLNHPLATSPDNRVWNGSSISLFGARNEVIAFQLIIQGSSVGATSVNVTLDSLHKASTPKYTIKNTGGIGDPYNFVGKRIEMFVEHYIDITFRSTASWHWWSSARPLPDTDYRGMIPEQLVPFEAPAGPKANGQGGAPFRVSANENQGVWVDIYIPRDAQAGAYTGTLRVTENSVVRYSIPVNLQVYNFALSDTVHLPNNWYIEDEPLYKRHGVANQSAQFYDLMRKYYQIMHRHRANLTHARVVPDTFFTRMGKGYTGEWYTSAYGYDGPGRGIGNNVVFIGQYDQPRKIGGTDWGSFSGFKYNADTNVFKQTWWTTSNKWMSWFNTNAPHVKVYKYGAEEPGIRPQDNPPFDTSAFPDMRRKIRWLKTNPGSGRGMKYLTTSNLFRTLKNAGVDLFLTTGQCGYLHPDDPYNLRASYLVDTANVFRATGTEVGFYTGTRPGMGATVIDAPAIDMRVQAWIMWKYNVDMYSYWFSNNYGDQLDRPIDPWARDLVGNDNGWGDGSGIYAGRNFNSNTSNDRGLNGPIVGIRVKNWRRGAQDYEYFRIARQLGLSVDALVNGLVPTAFDRVNQGTQATFPSRGNRYETVRRQLAEIIAATTSPLPFGTFGANPDALLNGSGNVILSWVSTNATSASINNGIGTVPLVGTRTVFLDTTTTFVLTLGNGSGSRTYTIQINVRTLPTGTLQATEDTLNVPGSLTSLSWTSNNALSARLDPGIGAVPVNGSRQVMISQYITYVLTLANNDGSIELTRPIYIRTLPSGTFTVTPDSVPYEGGSVTLLWTSRDAVTASLNYGIGSVGTSDSLALFVNSPATFSLTLTNPFGSRVFSQHIYQKPFVPRLVSIPPESLVAADPLTGRITKPVRRGRGYAPNWANLLSEVVVQGGFEPSTSESDEAGGMVIGIASMDRVGDNVWRPNPAAASSRSWVRLTKWQFSRSIGASFSAITASLEGREGRHVGAPRGFDSTGTPGEIGRRLLLKQLTKLAPKKHNNRLFAELVALKFNIAASQLGKTPAGFGDLIYNVDSSMCDGLMITQISDRADSIMTFWRGRPSAEYTDIYNAIRAINRAFTAPMDTISFESNGQLVLRGVVELSSIPFLLPPAGRVIMRTPTSTLTTGPDDELEEALYEDDSNPQISKLFQNFPNPFNPTTTISVGLREAGLATVEVYNILGQRVASLLNQVELDNGIHRIEFPAGDLASGVYFYRLTVRSTEDESLLEVQTKKMLLMK
jgi:hypothetical protein